MAGRRAVTWALMKSSWQVLKDNKSLTWFPIISGLCGLLVIISFVIPIILSPELRAIMPHDVVENGQKVDATGSPLAYLYYFAFYFVSYSVILFFNTGLISCALRAFNGETVTFKTGINDAKKCLPQILGWALIASSIGMVLRVIEDRLSIFGRIVAAVLGVTFSVTSYLVIPVMVAENKSPVEAFKSSAVLLKKTWGKMLKTNLSLGIIGVLLILPPFFIIPLSAISGSAFVIGFVVVIAIMYLFALILVQSALGTILKAAIYVYGRDGNAPKGFDGEMLKAAIKVKKAD